MSIDVNDLVKNVIHSGIAGVFPSVEYTISIFTPGVIETSALADPVLAVSAPQVVKGLKASVKQKDRNEPQFKDVDFIFYVNSAGVNVDTNSHLIHNNIRWEVKGVDITADAEYTIYCGRL